MRFPGHVLMIRRGVFWERITVGVAAAGAGAVSRSVTALGAWPRRLARRRKLTFARLLWTSGQRVAWGLQSPEQFVRHRFADDDGEPEKPA